MSLLPHLLYYWCTPPLSPPLRIIFHQIYHQFFYHIYFHLCALIFICRNLLCMIICKNLFFIARISSCLWSFVKIFFCVCVWEYFWTLLICENLFLFMIICDNFLENLFAFYSFYENKQAYEYHHLNKSFIIKTW